ncbi:Lysozyme [Hyella patelloides LEGE 07179]|uniref:Lysozyme n=1 Tax=Hyella patelloides LEGE 07179 TaxID=945734 RepID=A0A563VQ31_9CYAN|nr:glycoside hydrolase family protein [Hyella patelloides]VEP13504.1 Lysozyme [Hyella patelloides LEGE 07179]
MENNAHNKGNIAGKLLLFISFISLLLSLQGYVRKKPFYQPENYPLSTRGTAPLVMQGGDPYIRALMRTITASEANVKQPYHVIYGGSQVTDLTDHPDRCITITVGINKGNCSTAAGRYQMLNFVWDEKATRYHPNPNGVLWWKKYSFEPEYQDAVVHAWLSDKNAWGVDISESLKAGEIDSVLRLLSGTWTSLGYGIETNSMSQYLPQVYQNMLQEELS